MTHGLFVGTKRMTGFTHVQFTTCQWLLMSITHTTGFTREYYTHDRIHSWVQNCMTGVTREYFQLVSNRLRAVYLLCCTNPTHDLSLKFLEARCVTCVFCKLLYELYCNFIRQHIDIIVLKFSVKLTYWIIVKCCKQILKPHIGQTPADA